ncbi:trimethyltridecatetraene synthase-like [Salvia miltiorrhiza]|uniref:trimethyltridecatetraene synthase-like n=1 Tax=Salvia miltiorrhiza TaxID=226208 RepID=UPI0025ABDDD1|nr:trimethyltridecatetraene synthase-like [Salvia miltiorrhiza]
MEINGVMNYDHTAIGDHIVDFFSSLFSTSSHTNTDITAVEAVIEEMVENRYNNLLIRLPDEEEISAVVFQMEPNSSPGPDGFSVLVASSPEMARQFLKVHDAAFASRPAFAAYRHISFDYSDVSFAPYGHYWRVARKIVVTKVLCARKIDSFEHTRVEERRRLLSRLRSLSGKPVELREHLSHFTLSIICKMLFKDESIVDMDEVGVMVREWFLLNGAFNIGDWIPWLDSLDLQGYVKKMKALRKKMDTFCDYVIDDHLEKRAAAGENDAAEKDFVDVLLQLAEDEDEVEFTRDCAKALIMVIISHQFLLQSTRKIPPN